MSQLASFYFIELPGNVIIIIILACFFVGGLLIYIHKMPMPGVRCPACAARGVESWVLPGKDCNKCGHPC